MDTAALDAEFTKRCPQDPTFHVWLDSQIRPTIGATVEQGVGRSRPDVGEGTFSKMLQVMTTACQEIIPDYMSHIYITYSMGRWQRVEEFHLKFHLSTAAFLALTDALCVREGQSPGSNKLHTDREELERRGRKDNKADKFRAFFQTNCFTDLASDGRFHFATAKELDYPLICVYRIEDSKKSTFFSAADLPNALSALERYVSQTLNEQGYSVGMVTTVQAASGATPAEVSYQAAAVLKAESFSRLVGRDEEAVNRSWGWVPSIRQHHTSMELTEDRLRGRLVQRCEGRGRRHGRGRRTDVWRRRSHEVESNRRTSFHSELRRPESSQCTDSELHPKRSDQAGGNRRRRSYRSEPPRRRRSYQSDVEPEPWRERYHSTS